MGSGDRFCDLAIGARTHKIHSSPTPCCLIKRRTRQEEAQLMRGGACRSRKIVECFRRSDRIAENGRWDFNGVENDPHPDYWCAVLAPLLWVRVYQFYGVNVEECGRGGARSSAWPSPRGFKMACWGHLQKNKICVHVVFSWVTVASVCIRDIMSS